MMAISVMIPTYRRPQDLARCLKALEQQTRKPEQVVVVVRDTDTESWSFLQDYHPQGFSLEAATVKVPGVVAAMNVGLDTARGDIIAITDDDAAPHPDWLARIEAYFVSDPCIGGVGGRDLVYVNNELIYKGESKVVGKLQWYGRVIGDHHKGIGAAREVDVLKGVNMAYRRSAIAHLHFDERMLGTGAQVHFELAFSLALRSQGWKLIYDPLIIVDHYPAQRFDEDQRNNFNHLAWKNAVHNETLALLEYLPPLRLVVFMLWATLVGTRKAFGLLQLLRFLPKEKTLAWQKWLASMQGRTQAWQTWLSHHSFTSSAKTQQAS
ncbi:glycosyltransferase family 2 protein [Fischerella thermalis]|uniref:glycosyltransferase family 2 protein n=1 Tax=Fischerella thermalis TaxID=372787 RepID=UPI000C803C40|nr:glycosyltransferase [Fischerella thermalis]PLZ08713.1 glycosyl transferase family A [Fischerella thermalis WC119]PLZ09667.1 glycosyl transferase family A [Fischerella thermalis WC114]PLZ19490.1 glycosyl transferase family A [Fischerella thermalis WC157]PLZ57308.1 glycosyl transferase family A [Fischerella thermalis WC441]PLZ68485.1 glycosyl transferase family A [Fischerella thermalis WC344]